MPLVAIIVGALFIFVPMIIINYIKDILIKKKLKKLSKEQFDDFLGFKKIDIDEKEEEKNAREREGKFREFEKLRRIGNSVAKQGNNIGLPFGEGGDEGQHNIQDSIVEEPSTDFKRVKLSE